MVNHSLVRAMRMRMNPFSALSVEPYGESWSGFGVRCVMTTFSALSVEPYGESAWRDNTVGSTESFSALSVEPYGESAEQYRADQKKPHFQCSLCRAVW